MQEEKAARGVFQSFVDHHGPEYAADVQVRQTSTSPLIPAVPWLPSATSATKVVASLPRRSLQDVTAMSAAVPRPWRTVVHC